MKVIEQEVHYNLEIATNKFGLVRIDQECAMDESDNILIEPASIPSLIKEIAREEDADFLIDLGKWLKMDSPLKQGETLRFTEAAEVHRLNAKFGDKE